MEHPHLVIIGIKNETKLRKIAKEIGGQVVIREFIESNGEMTAFATQPVVKEQKEIFERFMLL